MSLMALLNAVHTYGISICGVTSVTSTKQKLILFFLKMIFPQNTAFYPMTLWLIRKEDDPNQNFCGPIPKFLQKDFNVISESFVLYLLRKTADLQSNQLKSVLNQGGEGSKKTTQ